MHGASFKSYNVTLVFTLSFRHASISTQPFAQFRIKSEGKKKWAVTESQSRHNSLIT